MFHLYKKHGAIFLIIFLAFFSVIVVWSLLNAIISAMIIAILINPLHKVVKEYVKSETGAALLTSLMTILFILLPIALITNALIVESQTAYYQINRVLNDRSETITALINTVNSWTGDLFNVQQFIREMSSVLITKARNFLVSLPHRAIILIVIVFLVYYFLKEQKKIINNIKEYLPLKKDEKELLLIRIKQVVRGVLYGTLLTAMIQGILAGIGYYMFGIPAPIMLALLTAFCALIPIVGTAIVWMPISIYSILVHLDDGLWWKGVGLFIYGTLIISTIDNFIKPYLIGERAKLHPALALLGILGGLQMFGIIGIVLGPLILGIFFEFVDVLKQQT